MNKLLVVSGFSAAGKGTIVRMLEESGKYKRLRSYTTRPPRDEQDYYYFVSENEFLEMEQNGMFLETNRYSGSDCYYATSKEELFNAWDNSPEKIPIAEIDYHGLEQLKRHIELAHCDIISIFIVASAEELYQRMMYRMRNTGKENTEDVVQRLKTSIRETEQFHLYDHIIHNKNITDTANKIHRIFEQSPFILDETFNVDIFKKEMNEIINILEENK